MSGRRPSVHWLNHCVWRQRINKKLTNEFYHRHPFNWNGNGVKRSNRRGHSSQFDTTKQSYSVAVNHEFDCYSVLIGFQIHLIDTFQFSVRPHTRTQIATTYSNQIAIQKVLNFKEAHHDSLSSSPPSLFLFRLQLHISIDLLKWMADWARCVNTGIELVISGTRSRFFVAICFTRQRFNGQWFYWPINCVLCVF